MFLCSSAGTCMHIRTYNHRQYRHTYYLYCYDTTNRQSSDKQATRSNHMTEGAWHFINLKPSLVPRPFWGRTRAWEPSYCISTMTLWIKRYYRNYTIAQIHQILCLYINLYSTEKLSSYLCVVDSRPHYGKAMFIHNSLSSQA